ncbi:MAG TPA: DUF2938 family protein, partial [Steroidobacteraceae bacterium]|nr:DUF2938 family protein [Steroidobacteraceae bacterium]
HYLLGMVFAAGLLAVTRPGWIQRPTLGPALIFGVLTVAVPFLVMQPAFGAGIAASRMPRPNAVRLQSLLTHLVFGFGLFVGGWAAHLFYSTGD